MSTVSTVSPLPTASDPAQAAELAKLAGFDRQVKKTMDQSDFLKLLSTQLANQNPLEPQKDTETVAQMATFSSVQQMGDLVTSLKSFIVSQDFVSAQNMLGKYVTVTKDDTTTSGIVGSVGYDENGVSVIKIGDKSFSPSDVTEVRSAAPTPEAEPTDLTPVADTTTVQAAS